MIRMAIRSRRIIWLVCVVVLISTVLFTGCSRRRYRLAADKQAYDLIAEKGAMCPAWDTGPWNVYGDPRSRYYDPCDPDRATDASG